MNVLLIWKSKRVEVATRKDFHILISMHSSWTECECKEGDNILVLCILFVLVCIAGIGKVEF